MSDLESRVQRIEEELGIEEEEGVTVYAIDSSGGRYEVTLPAEVRLNKSGKNPIVIGGWYASDVEVAHE